MTLDLDELERLHESADNAYSTNDEQRRFERAAYKAIPELIAAARKVDCGSDDYADCRIESDEHPKCYECYQAWVLEQTGKAITIRERITKERDDLQDTIDSIRMNIETEMLHGHDSSLAKYIMSITDGDA